jgi:CRP-like cAMP-binding protein
MLNMNFFGSVKKLKIFEGIDDTIVENILSEAQREDFWVGQIIIEQGEHPDGKGYIIESWSVDVWVYGKQTAVLSTWDIFWEIALLNEEPRTASVIARETTTVIVLSQETLFAMIENDDNTINKEIMRRMEENLENE